jgi:hypothetical protein
MTETERDPLDVEQTRVRLGSLILSAVAAVAAVVALGLELWLWAAGLVALAIAGSIWAHRMYASIEAYRAQVTAQGQATRRAYADPFADKPPGA